MVSYIQNYLKTQNARFEMRKENDEEQFKRNRLRRENKYTSTVSSDQLGKLHQLDLFEMIVCV